MFRLFLRVFLMLFNGRTLLTLISPSLLLGLLLGCDQDSRRNGTQQPPSPATATSADSADLELFREGAVLFSDLCTSCHGSAGNGRGSRRGPSLQRSELTYGNSREEIIESIRKGRPGGMPSYGHVFDDRQLEALSRYIISLKP